MQKKQRGSTATFVIGIILVLALVGYFVWTSKSPKAPAASGRALEMAQLIPPDIYAVWACDLRGEIDIGGWVRDFRNAGEQLEAADREEIKDFESKLRMPVQEWVAMFDGRAYLAVLQSSTPERAALIGVLGLAEGAKFDTWWEEQVAGYELPKHREEIAGVPFIVLEESYVGHDQNWVYFATDKQEAERVVAEAKGSDSSLAQDPLFQEGIKHLDIESSAAFLFIHTRALNTALEAHKPPSTDLRTFKELAPMQYIISSASFSGNRFDGLLRITEGESEIAKKLLTPGRISQNGALAISKKVTTFNSFDLRWIIESIIALTGVSPDTRMYTGIAGMALLSQGDPWASFTGEVSVGGNGFEKMVAELGRQAASGESPTTFEEPATAAVFPLVDATLAHAYLDKLLQIGGTAPKTGEELTYSFPVPQVVLKLRNKDKALALLESGPGSDVILDISTGHMLDRPLLKESMKWAGDSAVYLDFFDLQPSYDILIQELERDASKEAGAAKTLLERIRSRLVSLESSTAVAVRPYGLQYRSRGIANVGVLGIGAAIVVPGGQSIKANSRPQAEDSRRTPGSTIPSTD